MLTEADVERIAATIEAELASSTRDMYAGAWRQGDRRCRVRGRNAVPAAPEALAASYPMLFAGKRGVVSAYDEQPALDKTAGHEPSWAGVRLPRIVVVEPKGYRVCSLSMAPSLQPDML